MKKEVNKFLIIFLLIIILTGIISADGCSIVQRSSCNDYIVMGLSGQTNAHGQLNGQTPAYGWVLCCDFGDGDTFCTDTNKILSLSALTNAHAEIPYPSQGSNYDIPVCYDGLKCVNIIESCEDTINPDTGKIEYPLEILSLSSWTNGHIGRFADYPTKICCKGSECGEMMCEGASICDDYEYQSECECDPCKVTIESEFCKEGENSCLCEWKESTGKCFLNSEAIPPEGYCGDGEVDADLDEQCEGDNFFGDITGCSSLGYEGGDLSCYPQGHEEGDILVECTLDISECTGGITGGECGDNEINNFPSETCDCGDDEVCDIDELNNKECEDFGLSGEGLMCHLPGEDNGCTFDTTGCGLGEGSNPSKIGKCSYDENTEDDCEDKFLTYSWTATWTWAIENPGKSILPCEEDYVLDGGLCYYDPNGAKAKCVDGSNTVPCPAQIQLPFFGKYSVVMIITLIVLVYIFLNYKEKNSKKKRKKK